MSAKLFTVLAKDAEGNTLDRLSYYEVKGKRLTRRKCKTYLRRNHPDCHFAIIRVKRLALDLTGGLI